MYSHAWYFLFGVWQLEIAMQLSGVFCLKSGEVCVLISWPLVSNSKANSNAMDFLLNCCCTKLNFVSVFRCNLKKPPAKFCFFFLFAIGNYFIRVFLDFNFLLTEFPIKKFLFSRCVEEGAKALEFFSSTCA